MSNRRAPEVERVKILQITSYPPPRAGWGVRVEFLKKHLESEGHVCTVLNIGRSRHIPSPEYETVRGAWDYTRKVWRFSKRGYVVHMHVNGDSPKGFVLSLLAEVINLLWGKRCFLTFHAGVDQIYFPRPKWPLLFPMYQVLFGIPRRIICNNEAVKKKIVEYGVSPDKVIPIPAFSVQYVERSSAPLPEALDTFFSRWTSVVFTYIRLRPGFYVGTMIDGFAVVARQQEGTGLVVCGLAGDIEQPILSELTEGIQRHDLADRVCLIEDLTHEQFLEALSRSALYLRTPTTDGVASSVLESITLGTPVVASENGTRPPGVVSYSATDPDSLAAAVLNVVRTRDAVVAALPKPSLLDTVSVEAALLTGAS